MSDGVTSDELVDGRYRILNRIGSGGMADVYLAEDTHLGREVALKMLHRRFSQDAEFVERFRREASSAAGLQHPNVVNVFDRGEHDGTYYIAMEHLRGRSLKGLIEAEAPLEQERAIDLGIQILRAAGFAHKRGIIHRDFKPHNAILDSADRVKVTDFGIARAGPSEMTETGSIMGTAQYLSPEQAQGHGVGAASDLYSIGVIIYELLTGRVPFEGESAVSVALKHLSEPPPPLSSVRPGIEQSLEGAVMRALSKDPGHRYASAEDFIAALEAARTALRSGEKKGDDTALFAPVTAASAPTEVATPTPVEPVVAVELPAPAREAIVAAESPLDREQRRWPWVLLTFLVLVLAAGAGYALTRVDQVRVPNVVGESLVDASAALERVGLETEVRRVKHSAEVDEVVDQNPNADKDVDEGSTVKLEVSDGPGEKAVPSVDRLEKKLAVKELNRAGFKVNIDEEHSETIDGGLAIRTVPAGGARAEIGSRVRLFVSSGPELVPVPDLIGGSRDAAETALADAGLKAVFEEKTSDRPKDSVDSQDPNAGTSVKKGSRVTVTLSLGPEKLEVPDVVGLSEDPARTTLEEAGFKVEVRDVTAETATDDGLVLRQRPAAGEERAKGRGIVIYVGRATTPPPPGGTAPP